MNGNADDVVSTYTQTHPAVRDKGAQTVDADVHLSPDHDGRSRIGVEDLLRRMDAAGVNRSLVWLQPPYMRHVAPSNQYVYKAVATHPDRLIGFGWVDPHLGQQACLDEIDRCLEEFGFQGVKLNGAQNEFRIDDPDLSLPLIERIAAHGAVLALHIGADAYENTHPYRAGHIADQFPDLRILMVHMGGASFSDLSVSAIETARKHPNITLIGSAVRTRAIQSAIRQLGAHRVCFGSDTPFESMKVEVSRYKAILEEITTPQEAEQVMGKNILALLGMLG